MQELNKQLEKLLMALKNLISLFVSNEYNFEENLSAKEEAKKRLAFLNILLKIVTDVKIYMLKVNTVYKSILTHLL